MRGAYVHAFQTNGQIGHTCLGPRKLRWPKAPRPINPSLPRTPTTVVEPLVVLPLFQFSVFTGKDVYQFSIKKLRMRVISECSLYSNTYDMSEHAARMRGKLF